MKIKLKPVGYVSNNVKQRSAMKMPGVQSVIEIEPKFEKALYRIKEESHLWILSYFHKADTSVLRAKPRKISSFLGEKGVFAMRSPDRPNPIALTCVRLLSVKGRKLTVAGLDAMDGTPVLDIKPYSNGIDCVPFSDMPDFTRKYALVQDDFLARSFARIAENHTGPLDAATTAACALVFAFTRRSGMAPSPEFTLSTNLQGRALDVLCALFSLPPSRCPAKLKLTPGIYALKARKGSKTLQIAVCAKDITRFKRLLTM